MRATLLFAKRATTYATAMVALAVFLIFSINSYAQGADCGTSLQMNNIESYCSGTTEFTNAGATPSGLSLPACWAAAATEDVWFKFTAIGSDVLVTVKGSGSGGTMQQPRLAIYTGTCAALTNPGAACNNGTAGVNVTQLYLGALVQGNTYFIRISTTAAHEGSFQLCVNNYTPPASASADCGGAGKLCNKNSFSVGNLSGGGSNNSEIDNTCLGTAPGILAPNESNSIWYTWTCLTAGSLDLDIIPANNTDDIDFVVFQLSTTNPCGTRTVARCTAASCIVGNGGTGMNASNTDVSEAPGCTAPNNSYVQSLAMTAGTSYAILINNASATGGFTLNWGGTGTFVGPEAKITPTPITGCVGMPVTLNGNTSTNYTALNWNFNNGSGSPISATGVGPHNVTYATAGTFTAILNATDATGCKSVDAANIVITAPVVPTFTALAAVCQNATGPVLPTTSNNGITGTWSPAMSTTTAGTNTFSFTPTAGLCATTTTINLTVNPTITPTFNAIPSFCQGTTAPTLPASSTNTPAITGTWNPTTVSNATTGTYTFTPTSGTCVVTTSISVTVTPPPTATFTQIADFCQGTTAPTLPTNSTNSPTIAGTWNPSTVNNAANGTYTFTPNSGQCGASTTMTINVTAPPPVVLNPIASFCTGTTAPILPTTSDDSPGKTGSWNPTTVNNTTTGTYTFTPNPGQCAISNTLTITVTPAPQATFNPIPAFCSGTAAPTLPSTSTNSPTITGTWNPTTIDNMNGGTYTFTPNAGQCGTSNTLTVTITPRTTPNFNAIGPFCQNGTVPALQHPSNENITGTWNPTTISNSASGTYTFTPAGSECAVSTTLSVVITTEVTPSFAAIGPFCEQDAVPSLPATSTNSISGTWNPTTISNTTSNTYTFTPTAGVCATTASLSVVINPKQVPTFTAIPPFCAGTTAPSLPASSNDSPTVTGSWNPSTIDNATAGTFTFTFTPDAGQCYETTTLVVTITAPPVPTFAPVGPFCAGDAVPALQNPSTNSISGSWNPTTIDNMNSGSYTFTPTAGQCGTTAVFNVTITPKPTPKFNVIPPLCGGDSAPPLQNPSNEGINGTWNPTTVSNTTSGTYTFTPDPTVCATTAVISVTVGPPAAPVFTQIAPFCEGTTPAPTLPTTSNNGVAGSWNPATVNTTTNGTYLFTPNAGLCATTVDMTIQVLPKQNPTFAPAAVYCKGDAIPALPLSSTNTPAITGSWLPAINNQNTTTYTFTPNGSECANTTTLTITVNPANTPLFNAVPPICSGQTAPVLPTSSTNSITGTWNPTTVSNTATGTYTFTPDPGQCAETASLVVTVNSGPTITVPPATTCPNIGVVLTATGANSYVWTPNTGLSADDQPSVTATVAVTTTYHVVGTTTAGCTGSTDVTVTIAAGLNITVNPTAPTICAGNSVVLTASGGTTYDWNPKTNMNPAAGTSASVTVNPTTTTTYTVDGNTNGCTGQGSVTVTVGPPVMATFNPIPDFCTSEPAPSLPTLSNEGYAGNWSPSAVNITTTTTYTFTPAPTECALSNTLTIGVNPTPTLGSVIETCDPTNVNYVVEITIAGGTGPFTVSGTPAGNVGSFAGNVWTSDPIPTATPYSFDFTDSKGCELLDVSGQKNCNCATDVGTMGVTTLSLCAGQSGTATYNSAGEFRDGNDVLGYVLHTGSGGTLGTIIARSTAPTFSFNAGTMTFGTIYHISAIMGDNNGSGGVDETDPCLAVAIGQQIVWNATPVATPSNNGPVCVGDLLTVSAANVANASYVWTLPDNTTSNQQNLSFNIATLAHAGTYSLVVTVNNCPSAPVTTTVVVNAIPVANPASNQPICQGANLNLTATTVAGGTYSWTSSTTFTSGSQNPNIVGATPANAGNYTLVVSVGTCKSAPVTIAVNVKPTPAVTVTPTTATICSGSSTTLSGNGGVNESLWTPSTGLSSTTNAVVTANPTATTTYTYERTLNGCTATTTATVTVDPNPVVNTVADIAICHGAPLVFPAFAMTPAGGNASTTGFTWSNSNQSISNLPVLNNGVGNIPNSTGQAPSGQNTATFTVTPTRNGCPGIPETITVIVNALPVVVAVSDQPEYCEGTPIQLNNNIIGIQPTYSWTHSSSGFTSNLKNPIVPSAAETDEGTFSVFATDDNGCSGTGTVSIVVNQPVMATYTQLNPICENIATPQALVAIPAGGIWVGPGVSNNEFNASLAGDGTHQLQYNPPAGCYSSNTMSVVVNPMPLASMTATGPGCGPLTVNFTTDLNMQLTTWIFGDGTSTNDMSGSGAVSNVYTTPGYYDVTVTNTLAGCSTTMTYEDAVFVESDPVASFGIKEQLLYLTDPTAIFTNSSTGAVSYAWDFGDNTTSTVNNPTHKYDEVAATYTIELTATSAAGCVDVTTHTVQIKDQLLFFVPNTFTPDGDQHNNTFQPVFTSGFDPQNFVMYIYNRWGEIIFESHNAAAGWDGTYKGEVVNQGIYQWVMQVKDPGSDNKYDFQGHVFLVR